MNQKYEEPLTKEPVATGGWYERVDGTIGLYSWHAGQLKLMVTAKNWAEVGRIKHAALKALENP